VIFFDTSAIVGRIVQRDQHHKKAVEFWDSLSSATTLCFTSNFVLAEAITLIARRTSYPFATRQARKLYASTVLRVVRPEQRDEFQAVHFMNKYADHGIGFVDCISFAMMRRLGISDVFGFDGHFAAAGFHLLP
jgi:predicted nucleic acid-binding protein